MQRKIFLEGFTSDGELFKKGIWPAVLNFVEGLKGLILLNQKILKSEPNLGYLSLKN